MQGPYCGLTQSAFDSSQLLGVEFVSSFIPNFNIESHQGDAYGPDIPGGTQNVLPPSNCLLLLLTCHLLSQSQANSSQTWLYAPGLLHWSGPTCCPLLAPFTHIRLYRVRYGMPTTTESLYLTSSKACLEWSETWLSDDQSSFLKDGMPAREASFSFFF